MAAPKTLCFFVTQIEQISILHSFGGWVQKSFKGQGLKMYILGQTLHGTGIFLESDFWTPSHQSKV